MGKGEVDYEIRGLIPPAELEPVGWYEVKYEKLVSCDTQNAALRKLAKMHWPKNGVAIVPVRRTK